MREGAEFKGKCIAVFCGSASGEHHDYGSAASSVGETLAKADHEIVYPFEHGLVKVFIAI